MAKGFLHLHTTVVILFLIFYVIKTYLLLANKTEQLTTFRAKTKIFDIIFGSLMVITGIGLIIIRQNPQTPEFDIEAYHIVKILVAFASIPVGIIAFKKGNKILAVGLLIVFVYVFGVAETKSLTFSAPPKLVIPKADTATITAAPDQILDQNAANVANNGKEIFTVACTSCHGADGKMGLNGAKDLTVSTLSHAEKVTIITEGKGLMTGFRGQLSETEIEAVATYVDGLKK